MSLRIAVTHDFFGSFAPLKTSWGIAGGGTALRNRIEEMRNRCPTLWIDTGDLMQGGPLTPLTHGRGGIAAVAELGIDVSVLGNHELDFGVDFFQSVLCKLPFPVLGANAGIGLASTAYLETPGGDVGVIGLTHNNLASMRFWSLAPETDMPLQNRGENDVAIAALAKNLRQDGAVLVVAAVHDGIDWAFEQKDGYRSFDTELETRFQTLAGHVDLIVCGHTLGRYKGHVAGTPVIQPWPLGCEIGVVDYTARDGITLSFESVGDAGSPATRWTGHGADLIDEAGSDILGKLGQPLHSISSGSSTLAAFLADAILSISGSDRAFVYSTYAQPVRDGYFAFLAAGPVTRLDILQLVPYSDHRIVEADMDSGDIETLLPLLGPRRQSRSTIWAASGRDLADGRSFRLATISGAAPAVIADMVGRPIAWRETGATLFDEIRARLGRSR
jgi:2',3'-cyclic-nucleotide 2'-phosphodiesterase (5'-nucleotidase family)